MRAEQKYLVLSNLLSSTTDKMREIVHIQAGQCGNQIGAKVNTVHLLFFPLNQCRGMCGRHFVTPRRHGEKPAGPRIC